MPPGIPQKILIATSNSGKFGEMVDLLQGVESTFVSLSDFPQVTPPDETGDTYEDNALAKARYYAKETGLPCISDDSGLEIFALGGWPGLQSHRPMGNNIPLSDAELLKTILARMERFPYEPQRRARFVCAVCYHDPSSGVEKIARGSLYGLINKSPKGIHGFGYDPIFWVPDIWKTLGQATREEKNRYSHRRHAIVYLKPQIIHEFTRAAGFAV